MIPSAVGCGGAVLVVDDNALKRLSIRSVLAPLGYTIVEADSGAAALRVLLQQNFAVILLDVRMPILGGFETAALIRLRPKSEMTPIIFITSLAEDEISTARYSQGAVDFLFAPVVPDELRAKVSFFVNQYVKAEKLAVQAREVQASADKLRLLTEAAPIGIFQTDADNAYVYTNPQWSVITGRSAQEAIGRPWTSIVGHDLPASAGADHGHDPDEVSRRFVLEPQGPSARTVMVRSTPIRSDDGVISGWVGTLSDVTAEVLAENVMAEAQAVLTNVNVELAASARRDPLTGLGNRLALDEDLAVLEARATRYGHRYCVALIDIDHFKAFNDTYGHQGGDAALQAVAEELMRLVRGGDALYRYGGDELLCVFPEQDGAAGMTALERMRDGVEKLAISHAGNSFGVVTISAGLAALEPSSAHSVRDVIREADQALYEAKQFGRNRVARTPSALALSIVAGESRSAPAA